MSWIFTAICLTGTILNCKKKLSCFYFWMAGNVLWFIFDMVSGLYSRAILDAVQFALAVYGVYEWKKDDAR